MQTRYFILGITFIILVGYLNITRHDFINCDDNINIYENPYFHPINLSNTLHFWTSTYEHLYIPLTYTVWAMESKISNALTSESTGRRDNSHIFHTANLIIHILNAIMIFTILNLLVRNKWAACVGALLSALHPVQVETVAWASGLKGLLSSTFSLMAIWSFILYSSRFGSQDESLRARTKFYFMLTHLFFLLAMLAKPSAIMITVVLFIVGYLLFEKPLKQCVKEQFSLVIIGIPFIIVTKLSQPNLEISTITPLLKRPLIVGDTFFFYFSKLVYPFALGPDYGRTPQLVLQSSWIYFTGTLPFIIAAIILWRYRGQWPLAAIGIFLAPLLPVSGVIPFNFQNISTTADRYVYFSMFGPSLALAWFLAKYRDRRLLYICLCAIFCLGIRTFAQTRYWRNSITLFEHALSVNPNSWLSHNNLGLAFQEQGRYPEALRHYQEAVQLNPNSYVAYVNLGVLAMLDQKYVRAVEYYSKAIKLNPSSAKPHNNLANVYQKMGYYEKAIDHYNRALSLSPQFAGAIYNNIGSLRELQGGIEEAIYYYQKALAMNPNLVQARMNLERLMAQ